MRPSLTRKEWITRFTARYAALTGVEQDVARTIAETEAGNMGWEHGESGAARPSPESVAEELARDCDD